MAWPPEKGPDALQTTHHGRSNPVGVTAPVKGPAMERVDRAPRAPDLSVLLAGLVAGEGTSESRRTAPRA
jgi:hypothetical protein